MIADTEHHMPDFDEYAKRNVTRTADRAIWRDAQERYRSRVQGQLLEMEERFMDGGVYSLYEEIMTRLANLRAM